MKHKIRLETDVGGDTDDACALAMLLGCPDIEIVGITTTIDRGVESRLRRALSQAG